MLFDNCIFDFTAFVQEVAMWYSTLPRLNDSIAVVGSSVARAIRFMKLYEAMATHMMESFRAGYRVGQPIRKLELHGEPSVYDVTGFTALQAVYVEMDGRYHIHPDFRAARERAMSHWFARFELKMHVLYVPMDDDNWSYLEAEKNYEIDEETDEDEDDEEYEVGEENEEDEEPEEEEAGDEDDEQ
jgi:hypothetical protein